MRIKAMILAAGRGNRMSPLTDYTPKPLLSVGGCPLIVHHLLRLAKTGIHDIVINVAHHAEQIQQALGDGSNFGVNITYSIEQPPGLETGGGIRQALPLLGNKPFLVISADIWTDYPLEQLPHEPENLAHIVLVNNPDYHPHGDFYLQQNRILSTGDKRFTFGNIGVYRPELLHAYPPGFFRLGNVLREAIDKEQVTGELYTGTWYNIGTPEQLTALRKKNRIGNRMHIDRE